MKKENREVEDFYQKCAELLGTNHTCTPRPSPTQGPDRRNNLHAGNGRFPGFGIIRMFSPNLIHIALTAPKPINRVVKSVEEAYALLK